MPQLRLTRARASEPPTHRRGRHRVAGHPAGPRPRAALAGLTATVLVALASLTGAAPAAVAAEGGTMLLEDNFMSSTTVSSAYRAGGINFTACLTAGSNTATTPIPGCGGSPDAQGSGALRLTAAANSQAGFLLYDKALPTKAGLDITFNQYQWGGTRADGITFFLADGAQSLDRAGAFGGSLGYHHQNPPGAEGVPNALLGIGFDVWGNYTVETNDPGCGGAYTNASLQKNTVAVRGPGNGRTGYCLLGPVASATALGKGAGASSRPAPIVTRIKIDPPTQADARAHVYLDGVEVTNVPLPAKFDTTPTFKFGWGASTGGSTDFHEINFLKVESVLPILSDLRLSATTSASSAQSVASVQLTPRTDAASGPVPANEAITLTAAAPAGATVQSAAGTGWDCSGTTATQVSCSRTSGTAVDPGTTLPSVTVHLARDDAAPSGLSPFVATVASTTDDTTLGADNTATAQVRWNPVASPVDAGAVDASATPATATRPASVVGTGPFTYAVEAPVHPAVGSVTVDADGTVSFTPSPGASGLLQTTLRATDASGGTSNAVAARMMVRPVVTSGSLELHGTTSGATTLAPVLGSGAFTAVAVTRGSGLQSAGVTIDGAGRPVVTARGEAGFSGPTAVTFQVQDAYQGTSVPVTVPVVVHPVAGGATTEGTLAADGTVTWSQQLPTPSGVGPFTYAIADGDLGDGVTATLSPEGLLTVTSTGGASGTRTVEYTVADATSSSAPASVGVTVRPYLGTVGATETTAGTAATSPAPAARGTDVTWEHTTPAGTTVTVSPDGEVTLDADGASGTYVVHLTARDADGVASAPVAVTFVVAPVAQPVSGVTDAADPSVATVLTPAVPAGTGPFTYAVVSGLAPQRGTVQVVGSTLEVRPAAGVSGRLVASWVATDASGLTSAPVTATLDVRPVAGPASLVVTSGTTGTVTLPAPLGSGPFTWDVVSASPGATATVVDGVATVAASATYSGPVDVIYTVTDADGVTSLPAVVSVDVRPAAPGGTTTTPATTPGTSGSPSTGPTPQPSGTGPFTFEITDPPTPEQGTATIDPLTGVITFVPAPGFSGPVEIGYRTIDGNGTPSAPADVMFVIAPLAAPAGGPSVPGGTSQAPVSTPAGRPVTLDLPAPVGTGPFTWELVDGPAPADGTATLDPATGRLVLTPALGRSGRIEVTYRVLDASGTASALRTAYLEVRPTATGGSRHYPAGSTVTYEPVAPVGTGPFTWSLVGGTTAAQGVVTIDPATGRISFAPASGFTGSAVVRYVVTDADGVASDPVEVELVADVPPVVAAAAALARTGAEPMALVAVAAGTVLAGLALVLVRRRRTA